MSSPSSAKPIYFVGCDMGGWQSTDEKKGDALAVCKWTGSKVEHFAATAAIQYFPVEEAGVLAKTIDQALAERARIIIGIDAALGWPVEFTRLVRDAAEGIEFDTRRFESAIKNPYLYRETERFIKSHVRRDKDPLTAPGDKFGNNSSKAQMLVAWFRTKLPAAYRPPFGGWDAGRARQSEHSIIEVYPDASLQCRAFDKKVRWPAYEQEAGTLRSKDIADAKVCSLTAICYAMELGIISRDPKYPRIYLPDHPLAQTLDAKAILKEGWIFAPYAETSR
jgi:hypothetical protein